MSKLSEFDAMCPEEFLLLQISALAAKGLVISGLTIEPDIYKRLEDNLGSKVNRTKKGWIILYGGNFFCGIPAFEVVIKPRRHK